MGPLGPTTIFFYSNDLRWFDYQINLCLHAARLVLLWVDGGNPATHVL